ncbi:hypothetical protein [Streptomyces cyaneofuscatus]|uniref:hypothetical protein n=1 Tax=Streptomyces cyaneofuscatus TaxID=66883 RepID=UPI003665DC37
MQIIPEDMCLEVFDAGWIVADEVMRGLLSELSPGSHFVTVVVDGESLELADRITLTTRVRVAEGGRHRLSRRTWERVVGLLAVGVADAEREGQIVVVSPASNQVTRCWDLWKGRISSLPVAALSA